MAGFRLEFRVGMGVNRIGRDALIIMRSIFRFLPLLLLTTCGRGEPLSYESIAWINNFYIEHPVASLSPTAGGWLFRGAQEKGGELSVGFLIPEPMNGSANQRRAIIRLVCPTKSERIWQLLPSGTDLVISVWSPNNKFKDAVTC